MTKQPPEIITPTAGDTSFPEMTTLSNGLPVYLIGSGTLDLLRIEFVLNAGQLVEKVHLAASTANAMLTEGTVMHDAITLNSLIDSTGAVFNHSADKDTASLVTVTLTRKLEEVMDLAEEVLFHPAFPDREFRMLTEKRIQSWLTGRQKTSVIAREQFYRLLCGNGNPYGRVTSLDDYHSLTTQAVREFHTLHYSPADMYITVAGFDPEKALPVLEKHFAAGNAGKWHKPEIPIHTFETAEQGHTFCEVANSVQSTVRLGWKGVTREHNDYQGLQVASMILGGYFGSRLMRNIREEKGYTYGIHSVVGALHGLGFITIFTDVANIYREETVKEIWKEITELAAKEISNDELTVVRNHIMGETARMFDGPFSIAETIRSIIDYDLDREYYTRFAETVRTITPRKIRELFNTYFNIDDSFEIIAGAK